MAESVGGVILTPTTTGTDVTALWEFGIPAVLADRTIRAQRADSVVIDNAGGAQRAVEHLIDGGYERIACITGPLDKTIGSARYAGHRAALAAAERPLDESRARVANFRETGGRVAMQELLAVKPAPDAVFVANNLMTIGALHAIAEAGLTIPGQIAVVGFDEMSWATLLRPALTTVAQPTYYLGVETGRLLRSRIEGYDGAARTVTLAPSLRVRESSPG